MAFCPGRESENIPLVAFLKLSGSAAGIAKERSSLWQVLSNTLARSFLRRIRKQCW